MKDYPKEIRDRVKEIAGNNYDSHDSLATQFSWYKSREGHEFWSNIDDGNYDVFYDRYCKEENEKVLEKVTKLNTDCNWLHFDALNDIEVNEPEIVSDSIVEKVIESFKERSNVGIKKYGVTLDRDDFSLSEWLTEAQQEAMDFVLYLEATKNKIKKHGLYI